MVYNNRKPDIDKVNQTQMTEKGHAYVKPSSTSGRGLFAKKDVPAGEQIFSLARPLIAVLDSVRCNDCCSNCFAWTSSPVASYETWGDAYRSEMKACSQCKILKFCGRVGWRFLCRAFVPPKHRTNTLLFRRVKPKHGRNSTNLNANPLAESHRTMNCQVPFALLSRS